LLEGVEVATGEEVATGCVGCGSSATSGRPLSVGDESDSDLPVLELCEEHWAQYRTDWFLVGWCVDHYGEALRFCTVHRRTIEPI
jgi:hypothetical protein